MTGCAGGLDPKWLEGSRVTSLLGSSQNVILAKRNSGACPDLCELWNPRVQATFRMGRSPSQESEPLMREGLPGNHGGDRGAAGKQMVVGNGLGIPRDSDSE